MGASNPVVQHPVRRDQSKWRGLYNPQAEKEEQIERIREDGWFGAEG